MPNGDRGLPSSVGSGPSPVNLAGVEIEMCPSAPVAVEGAPSRLGKVYSPAKATCCITRFLVGVAISTQTRRVSPSNGPAVL